MPFSSAGLNAAVDGVASAGVHIALHTADPTGANQVGSRSATSWGAASNGSRSGSQVSISIPAGTTVTHYSVWSAATGGTMLYSAPLPAAETFAGAGTYQITPTITAANIA